MRQYISLPSIVVTNRHSVVIAAERSVITLVVNMSTCKYKAEALWLGCWRSHKDKPFGFKWPQEPVYALGIHFSYDLKQANTLNFEEKVCSLEKTLNNWKKRKLTLIGKINIVKTLGLSKLIYCSSLLTVSKSLIDRINKIIFSFIWEGKPPKIKKKTIIGEKHCGGPKND